MTTTPSVPSQRRRRLIRSLALWVPGLLLLGGLVAVVLHLGDLRRFDELVAQAHPLWLLAGCGLQAATYVCAGGVWYLALDRAGSHRPLAAMLRIAVPYGTLSTRQLRKLADIARRYDKGYGHFTTRQNLQFNWIRLEDTPDILAELASVEMHAIQTSGNCIRNVTADHFAGVAGDEIEDPRIYCEIIRQWSTFHPEFSFLPRKFKIAVTGSPHDRAAVKVHDIGLRMLSSLLSGSPTAPSFRHLYGAIVAALFHSA